MAPDGAEIPCSLVPDVVSFLYESFITSCVVIFVPLVPLDFLAVGQTHVIVICFWLYCGFISAAQTTKHDAHRLKGSGKELLVIWGVSQKVCLEGP